MVYFEYGGDPWLVRCVLVFDVDWLLVTLTTLSQLVDLRTDLGRTLGNLKRNA